MHPNQKATARPVKRKQMLLWDPSFDFARLSPRSAQDDGLFLYKVREQLNCEPASSATADKTRNLFLHEFLDSLVERHFPDEQPVERNTLHSLRQRVHLRHRMNEDAEWITHETQEQVHDFDN